MTNKNRSRWSIPILIGVLVLQTFFMAYFGIKKEGYHDDEMATYTLSNYKDGFIIRTKNLIDNWVDGDVLFNTLTVSDDESFDYKAVYENQERDVHPPLYYYIIHTISSLFQWRFSKWIGIVPNIVFCLLISVFLFLIAKRLLQNDVLALITVCGWSFSIGAIDTVTFIRMYAMLTFFVVFFIFLHIKALDNIISGKKILSGLSVPMFFCTIFGLLTHYYFAVFALFSCSSFLLYLIFTRQWKDVLIYSAIQFGAVAAAILYYPAMLRHIFGGGYRGQEAFQNLTNTDNSIGNLKNVLTIISNDILNGWTKELICICLVMLLILIFKKYITVTKTDGKTEFEIKRCAFADKTFSVSAETTMVCIIGTVLLLYIVLISKIAPFQRDRYYMCLYPFLILVVIFTIHKLCNSIVGKNILNKIIPLLLVVAVTGFGAVVQEPSYLYAETADRGNELEKYSDMPAIVLNDAYDWHATAWLPEYKDYSEVYICQYKSWFSGLTDAFATKDINGGFLLYVLRFSESDEDIENLIREHLPIEKCEKVCDGQARVFFCSLGD